MLNQAHQKDKNLRTMITHRPLRDRLRREITCRIKKFDAKLPRSGSQWEYLSNPASLFAQLMSCAPGMRTRYCMRTSCECQAGAYMRASARPPSGCPESCPAIASHIRIDHQVEGNQNLMIKWYLPARNFP